MNDNEIEAQLRVEWAMRLWGVEAGLSRPWPEFRRVWSNASGQYRPRAYVLARCRKRQPELL